MNTLLVFFAIPLATIILSAILETFINSPIKVAGIFFSIFIVVAFALGGTAELILAAIVYTVISFITAFIVHVLMHKHECDNSFTDTSNSSSYYVGDCSNLTNTTDSMQTENTSLTNNDTVYNNSRCRYR